MASTHDFLALKGLLLAAGISQGEAARRLHRSRSRICKVLNGNLQPGKKLVPAMRELEAELRARVAGGAE